MTSVVSASDYYPGGMLMAERKYASGGYRYGFNGQERSSEIHGNSFTAEFWEYDARIGRRWNLDPRPNISLSPFACFEGNPIWNRDPKGDSIDIKHKPVIDKSGQVVAIDVSITVTGKVLNISDYNEIDVDEIGKYVNSELKRLIDGKVVDPGGSIKWNVTINSSFTTVTSMDQVKSSDHLIVIVDDVDYNEGLFNQSTIGVAKIGGKISYVEAADLSSFGCNRKWRPDYHQMGTVAVHELFHNMGLIDLYDRPKSEQIPGNYMMEYDPDYSKPTITNQQIFQIISAIHNVGDNFSYKDEVRNSGWIDTSNSDPRKKSAQGSDGKIPKVID